MLNQEIIQSRWDLNWGDRMNELVFIGQEMDKEKINEDLTKCLLTELEVDDFRDGEEFFDRWPL